MRRRGLVEDVPIRKTPFREVAPRATDEVVRLADGRRHDPFAGGRDRGAPPDAGDDLVVRARVGDVDERFGEGAEVQRVRVRVDEPRHHRRSADVDLLGARAGDSLHRPASTRAHDPSVAHDQRLGGRRHAVAEEYPSAAVEGRRHSRRLSSGGRARVNVPPPPGRMSFHGNG